MSPLPKRVHIIGICGVATSALAIALHRKGVKVTGSDKGFYPPVSTSLSDAGVPYYAGWHPENMSELMPELVIIGGIGTSPSNPEIAFAREHDIPIIPFAEALGRYVIKKHSIVVAGTWGKTTTSSLLSYILLKAEMDPSYFTGGISLSHDTSAISDGTWSVVEGDEYQISISDRRPKFAFYSPTHLLLTSASWDHADLYPTEDDYFSAFKKMIDGMPSNGAIVYCADDSGVARLLCDTTSKGSRTMISYGKSMSADYRYDEVRPSRSGIEFRIHHTGKTYVVSSPMFGRFNAENITAAFAMAHNLGIDPDVIISAITSFRGIKRRFEKRHDGDVTILDCHAPTPDKALSVLENIKEVYTGKIIVVFEPNIGGRQHATAHAYDHAFKDADIVVIPRLTKLKTAADGAQPMEGDELAATIAKTHQEAVYIDDDALLVKFIAEQTQKGDCVAFLGSHGFRGMIEETVKSLNDQ